MRKLFFIFIALFLVTPLVQADLIQEPFRKSNEVFSTGYYEKVSLSNEKNLGEEGPDDFIIIKDYIIETATSVVPVFPETGLKDKIFVLDRFSGINLTTIDFNNNSIKWMLAKGNFLFIGFDSGFRIYDISSLPDISLVKTWDIQALQGTSFIGNKDDYLFFDGSICNKVNSVNGGCDETELIIKIYNINDPCNVFLTGEYKNKKTGKGSIIGKIESKGDFIYIPEHFYHMENNVFTEKREFSVLDISDINNIKEIAEHNLKILSFKIVNNYLYALTTDDKFIIFNFSNPYNMEEVGSYPIASISSNFEASAIFQIAGNYAFIIQPVFSFFSCSSYYDRFLHILDLNNPQVIKPLDIVDMTLYPESNRIFNMKIINNYLYISGKGIHIMLSDCFGLNTKFLKSYKLSGPKGLFDNVGVLSFDAKINRRRVILTWQTEFEYRIKGFYIKREEEKSNMVKIFKKVIPSKGDDTKGAKYKFTDSTIKRNKTYKYTLFYIDKGDGKHSLKNISVPVPKK